MVIMVSMVSVETLKGRRDWIGSRGGLGENKVIHLNLHLTVRSEWRERKTKSNVSFE